MKHLPDFVTIHKEWNADSDVERCDQQGGGVPHRRDRTDRSDETASAHRKKETPDVAHLCGDEVPTIDINGRNAMVPGVGGKELLSHWILQKGI